MGRSISEVDRALSPPTTGLSLHPIAATRYIGVDLPAVTSPPYDVVEPDRCNRLESADPHNVVRLILPQFVTKHDPYELAASTWRRWHEQGVLQRDTEPALWVYEQEGPGGLLVGLVGTVPVDEPHAVLPHEDVMPGPVLDRARLMTSVGANLEPILLVHDSTTASSTATELVDRVRADPPALELSSDDGARHRLWRLTDPQVHASVTADLAGRSLLIADGHHRFAAYQRIERALRGDPTESGWRRGLALVVDGGAHPLRLGAIHRCLHGLELLRALDTVGADVDVVELSSRAGSEDWLHESPSTALVITDGSRWVGLASENPELVPRPERSAEWRSLPSALLHEVLIPERWQLREDAVTYHHTVAGALRMAAGSGIAVLLPPLTLATVIERASAGELLPRKSTSFGPKPRTGLLMRQVD